MSARSLEGVVKSVTATGCIGGGQPIADDTAACGFTSHKKIHQQASSCRFCA